MLKITGSLDVSVFGKNDGKYIIVEFDDNDEKLVRKLKKSKSQKLSKF